MLGAACHILLQGFILPILQHTATTERDRDLNVMIKTSRFQRLLVEKNRDNLVKVLLSLRQMYNRRARLTCNTITQLKKRERERGRKSPSGIQ